MAGEIRRKRIEWLMLCLASPEIELTDWEQKFFESIEKQFKERGTLSDNQFSKLEDIYERVQGR
jgi:hypothetical protein